MNTQEEIREIMRKLEERRRLDEETIKGLYDTKKLDLLSLYYTGVEPVTLAQMCTPEMIQLLFLGDMPLLHTEVITHDRKQMFGEKELIQQYCYQDPRSYTLLNPGETGVDIIAQRKTPGEVLRAALEQQNFFPHCLVDLEFFEYPHYSNDTYFRGNSDILKELHKALRPNQEISQQYRKDQKTGLYREMEKIHLLFAVGLTKGNKTSILPVYIGIGTNEPYGLPTEGPSGPRRFIKYKIFEAPFAIERGTINQTLQGDPKFPKDAEATEMTRGPDGRIVSVTDNSQGYDETYDESRFKGFFRIHGKKIYRLEPGYIYCPINQTEYLHKALNTGEQTIGTNPIIRTTSDLFQLVSDAIREYERFAMLAFDPEYMVRQKTIDKIWKKRNKILPTGTCLNAMNLASDLYALGVEPWERLKFACIVFGAYAQTGKLDEIILNTAESRPTTPLEYTQI